MRPSLALAAPLSVAALLWTPFVAGCSAPATPTALCVEQIKVSCAFQFRCCTDAEDRNRFLGGSFALISVFFSTGPSTTEAECVEHGTAICEAGSGLAEAGLERDRVEFDAEAAARCLDSQRDALASCDVELLREENDDCREVLVGLGQEGDPCLNDDECGDDAQCEFETDNDGLPRRVDEAFALPEGECVELVGEGDDCGNRGCREGLFCNDVDTCERLGREGDACTFNSCGTGLFCNDVDACERESERDEQDFDFCRG